VSTYASSHLLLSLVIFVISFFVVFWPYAIIFSRAGHSKWLVVLMLVPIVNIILLWWFASTKWTVAPQT
jgi:hypothetical protein